MATAWAAPPEECTLAANRRIGLLGGLRVIDGDREITHFVTQKTASLLGFLAYHREQAHLRDTVIEMLWPWASPGAGRQSLSTALSALRHQLEPIGFSPGSVLLTDRNTVRLNPETTVTDVQEFETALANADKAGPSTRRRQLERAITLYRGDLLAGLYETWIPPEAERLAERFQAAASELARILAARGEKELAATHLERAIETAPQREELYRQLMCLYSALGDPHLALDLYAELEAGLRQGRRQTPAAATQELAQELKHSVVARPMATAARRRIIDRRALRGAPATLPTGTVTFIAILAASGSEPELRDLGFDEEMRRHGGVMVEPESNNAALHVMAFSHAGDALNCVAACQLRAARSPSRDASRPAMAVHTCQADVGTDGRYPRGTLEHVLSLLAVSHPGQILYTETAAALVRHGLSGGFGMRKLGRYRLPGGAAPEPLCQIDYPGGPESFPPLRAEPGPANHLPVRMTRFFGREGEILQIEAMLSSGARLITLVGAPGCGKTRLALEMANRMVEAFAGRVWFVPLTDLPEGSGIHDRTLDSLRITRSPRIPPLGRIESELADHRALIVFDNFEHLLGAAGELSTLLEHLPHLHCLVTSRRRLNLPEEECFGVYPLPTPMDSSMKTLLANESIRLFIDRAQAVAPEFDLTADNSGAVAEICARLDGIPLAVELAAGRLNVLAPDQILEHLGGPGTLMSSRIRDDDTRHRTLRAAVDWSYSLLDPELQTFFAQLSVFAGGWTTEAAEAVCDQPLAEDRLSELSAWSLVLFREASEIGAQAGTGSEPRFEMYASLREFAREKLHALDADLERQAEERHGRWYAQHGTDAAITALDLHGGVERRKKLGRELENLVVACQRASERGDGEIAGDAYCGAAAVLLFQGPFHRAISLGERVGALPLDQPHRIRVLRYLGIAELRSGQHDQARGHFEAGLALARETGQRRDEGMLLACLYSLCREQNRFQEARSLIEGALAIAREVGDRINEGIFLGNLGSLDFTVGRVREAESHTKAAIAIHREVGNRSQEGLCLGNFGVICREQGRTSEARTHYESALAIHREVGNRRLEGVLLGYLGNLCRSQGKRDESRTYLEAALAIHREVGNLASVGITLGFLGNLHREQGRIDEAVTLYDDALAVARKIGDRRTEGTILGNLGISQYGRERMQEAESYYRAAIAIHRETSDSGGEGRTLHSLGLLCLEQNRLDEAQSHFESALDTVKAGGNTRSEGAILESLGSVFMAKGLIQQAREAIDRGEEILRAVGNPWELASLYCTRAQLEMKIGNPSAAITALRRAEDLAVQAGAGPESELAKRLAEARLICPAL